MHTAANLLSEIKVHINRKFPDYLITPLGLLATCILAYGVLAPWLGFYLDDWYIIYYQKLFGAGGFINFFRGDRPLLAYVYMVIVPILRDSRIGWQLFAVFTHWLAVVSFWYLLVILMPKQKTTASIVAFLFAVYPGFQFQWFSVMYSQVYLLMSVYFLSYILMVLAVKKEHGKVPLMIGAFLSAIVGIIPMEYFYGLELVRPFVLWIAIENSRQAKAQRIKQAVFYWIPFLTILIGFPFFRSLYSHSYSYQINIIKNIRHSPFKAIIDLVGQTFWTILDANLTVWSNLVLLFKRNYLTSASILMGMIMLLGVLISYLILKRQTVLDGNSGMLMNGNILIGLGVFASLVAMIPFVAASFEVSLKFPYNRFLLSLAPGASIFLTGIIIQFIHTPRQKIILVSVLIGLATGSQFLVARSFLLYWNQQQDFFWQLTWRMPQLRPNTLLVTYGLNFAKYFSDTSLSAPLNLIYAPGNRSNTLPFMILMTSSPQVTAIHAYKNNIPINYSFRSLTFTGNTSSMVAFYKPNEGCLQVLSQDDIPDEFSMDSTNSFYLSPIIPLSNLNRIITQPATPSVPPEQYFGKENKNEWCYYFEKASLALQIGNLNQVVSLYQKAEHAGLKPGSPYEWLPLIEAYIRLGQIDNAVAVTKGIKDLNNTNHAGVCYKWSRLSISNNFDSGNMQKTKELLSWAHCK
jgi:hypothetical protein